MAEARRRWQIKGGGDLIEIIGHFQVGIVHHVVGPPGFPVLNCGQTGSRQIVGMNVIGKYVIGGRQCRQTPLQTIDRQAIGRIDAGRPQDADGNTVLPPPGPQNPLRINPPGCPLAFRIQVPRLIDVRSRAIAVNPCRTYVNQASW